MSDYYPKCEPDVQCPHCNPQSKPNEQSSLAPAHGYATDRKCRKCDGAMAAISHNSGNIPGIGYESETTYKCNSCGNEEVA
jgi:hypothetical protein